MKMGKTRNGSFVRHAGSKTQETNQAFVEYASVGALRAYTVVGSSSTVLGSLLGVSKRQQVSSNMLLRFERIDILHNLVQFVLSKICMRAMSLLDPFVRNPAHLLPAGWSTLEMGFMRAHCVRSPLHIFTLEGYS